ncbi:hypothetical protein HK405_011346, partial [Cladochytrium tenue]
LANICAVLTIAIGALVFHQLEDMSYEDAFPFAIEALLGVSYGTLGTSTTGGRLFLFAYFAVGGTVLAFFFVGLQDRVLERMAEDASDRLRERHLRRKVCRRLQEPDPAAGSDGDRRAAAKAAKIEAKKHALASLSHRAVRAPMRLAVWLGAMNPTPADRAVQEARAARAARSRLAANAAAAAAHRRRFRTGDVTVENLDLVLPTLTNSRLRHRHNATASGGSPDTFNSAATTGRRAAAAATAAAVDEDPVAAALDPRGTLAILSSFDDAQIQAELEAVESSEAAAGTDDDEDDIDLQTLRSPTLPTQSTSGSLPAVAALAAPAGAGAGAANEDDGDGSGASTAAASEGEFLLEKELERREDWRRLRRLGLIFFVLWMVSASVFQAVEPTWTWFDSVYFSFTTMSAIAFGDLYPTTSYAWELWFLFVLLAVALVASLVSIGGELVSKTLAAGVERAARARAARDARRDSAALAAAAADADAGADAGASTDVMIVGGVPYARPVEEKAQAAAAAEPPRVV